MSSILSELSRLTGKEGDSICEVLENVTALGMSEADVDAKLDSLPVRFLKSGNLNNIKEPGIYYFSWEEAKNIDDIPTGISDFEGFMFKLDVTRVLGDETLLLVTQRLYCVGSFQPAIRKWTRSTSYENPETFDGWMDVYCPLNVDDTRVWVTSNFQIDNNGYLKIGKTSLTEVQLKKLLALITS